MRAVVVLFGFAPVVGAAIVGGILAARGGWLRLAGLGLIASAIGYLIAWNLWWDRDCYDVGEIQGCGGPSTYLTITWFASLLVFLVATVAVVRHALRRRSEAGSR